MYLPPAYLSHLSVRPFRITSSPSSSLSRRDESIARGCQGTASKGIFCTQALSLWKSTISRIHHDSKKRSGNRVIMQNKDFVAAKTKIRSSVVASIYWRFLSPFSFLFSLFWRASTIASAMRFHIPSSLLYTKRQIRALGHKPVVNEGCFAHHSSF